jgi:hypothetical protein
MRYMLIHCIDEDAERAGYPQDRIEAMPSLAAWHEEMQRRGVALHGARLRYVSDATTVQVRDREVLVSDGPFAETKEQIAGYDIIECADLDEALEVAAEHPTAWLGTIEVRPIAGDDGENVEAPGSPAWLPSRPY